MNMDGKKVLDWLIRDSEKEAERYYGHQFYPFDREYKLEELIFELRNRRELPSEMLEFIMNIPSIKKENNIDESHIVSNIKNIFNSNITLTSLVLNNIYPNKYFYYRVSKLEPEIFSGIKFLRDYLDEFDLPFSKIGAGTQGFDRYLMLNRALHSVAKVVCHVFCNFPAPYPDQFTPYP